MTIYDKLVDYTELISKKVEERYPDKDFSLLDIWLVLSDKPSDGVYDGVCHVAYKKNSMRIEMFLPNIDSVTAAVKRNIAVVLVHEYCHYVDAISNSAKVRHADGAKYETDSQHVHQDEVKNWSRTKDLLIDLGLWSKRTYNICRKYKHTSHLEF